MTFSLSRPGAALFAACLATAPLLRGEPGHPFAPLTPAEISAIAAAVPDRAAAVPAKPRAVLIFYRTEGYVHPCIPYANEALRQLGARTGAFRADFSDDMSVFTFVNLARYDAVIFQNTTDLAFKDPAQRAALLDFVRSGKGFVGLHSASDNFYSWPEAQAMLGGVFHGHPWNSESTVAVKVDDPRSPLTRAFGGRGFWVRDEIYQITGPYSRDKQRVLLSLDMSKSSNYRLPDQFVRTDSDFPIAWVKTYGKGRVFYNELGHNIDMYSVPELLQFDLAGIQFALGDLPADATPPVKPIVAALAPVPSLPLQNRGFAHSLPAGYLDDVAAYDFGKDRAPLIAVDIYLRAQGPKAYPAIERDLISLLARPSLPDGAKDYALRTLVITGSPASVPVLTCLLGDPRFGSTAVQALFDIPGAASDAALLGALDSLQGPGLDTVIGAVGRRRLESAIPRLAALGTSSADRATRLACLTALEAIGTPGSLQALRTLPADKPSPDRAWAELGAASLILSGSAVTPGERHEVEVACREILASPGPDVVHIAALQGMAQAADPAALPAICSELLHGRPRVRLAAANLFAQLADRAAIARFAAAFTNLAVSAQPVVLDALDSRRATDALPLFLAELNSPEASVRLAAIHGLGDTADTAAIAPLLARLDGDNAESLAAADSLGRLKAPGVVESLIASLEGAPPREKAAVLQIIGARVDHRVYPFALAAVGDSDAAVRTAAFEAIAATSRQDDLPTVLALLPRTKTAGERRYMERALLEAVRAAPNPDAVVDAINGALASTEGPARYSLLTALALAGTGHSRAILAAMLHSKSSQDRRETIRAISGARNPALEGLLIDAIKTDPDRNERIMALGDYLDLLQVPNGRTPEQLVEGYARAWPLAERAEERDAIIAGLRRQKTDAALLLADRLEGSRPKA